MIKEHIRKWYNKKWCEAIQNDSSTSDKVNLKCIVKQEPSDIQDVLQPEENSNNTKESFHEESKCKVKIESSQQTSVDDCSFPKSHFLEAFQNDSSSENIDLKCIVKQEPFDIQEVLQPKDNSNNAKESFQEESKCKVQIELLQQINVDDCSFPKSLFINPVFKSPTNVVNESEKNLIYQRISSSVSHLLKSNAQKRRHKEFFSVILYVLSDVRCYFLGLSIVDKIELIQNSVVPYIVDGNQKNFSPIINTSLLSKQEQDLLFFCRTLYFCGKILHYRVLFSKFLKQNKYLPTYALSDFDQYCYFKKLDHLFTVKINGLVEFLLPLPELGLDSSFFPDVFKLYRILIWTSKNELVISKLGISKNERVNNTSAKLEVPSNFQEMQRKGRYRSKDIWYFWYSTSCAAVTFLLRCFGPLHFLKLKECVSGVWHELGIVLSELSFIKQQELFSSIPKTMTNENSCMCLTGSYLFDTTFISKTKLSLLFIVGYLTIYGKTHSKNLTEKFNLLAPKEMQNDINLWIKKESLKHFQLDCDGYLSLSSICRDMEEEKPETALYSEEKYASEQNSSPFINNNTIKQEVNALDSVARKVISISKEVGRENISIKFEKDPSSREISATDCDASCKRPSTLQCSNVEKKTKTGN